MLQGQRLYESISASATMSSEDNTLTQGASCSITYRDPAVPHVDSLRARMVLATTREGNCGLTVTEEYHCFLEA